MVKLNRDNNGFSAIEVVLVLVTLAIVGVGGYLVAKHIDSKKTVTNSASTSKTSTTTPVTTVDPYAGWKTAISPRAKFSIKYPSDWAYSEQSGDKDNVEHITITSSNMKVSVDSYSGTDPTNGGITTTTCPDCQKALAAENFVAGSAGTVNLQTITYTLDSGLGNALVLRQPDSTYYMLSPTATGVRSSFRVISVLGSLQAYQNETPAQFSANSDYATAQKILKSVSY